MKDIEFNLGIVDDPRTPEQKAKDYQHTEGAIIINWIEKPIETWKKFVSREQNGSLSCCGQSAAKAMEVLKGEVLSAHPIYRSRANFPDGGMYLQNVGDILKKVGTTTEALDKSEWMHESEINRDITVATPTKANGYYFVDSHSIDAIAEAIEVSGHCLLIVHCYKNEWSQPMPEITGKPRSGFDFGHCICAVDYFLYKGKKVILIEDSTGHNTSFNKDGQRLVHEEFLSTTAGAMYVTCETFKFTLTLRVGSRGEEVKKLQKLLYLPTDGVFGPITRKAVSDFQWKHGLIADGIVGPQTRVELNKLL